VKEVVAIARKGANELFANCKAYLECILVRQLFQLNIYVIHLSIMIKIVLC